MTKIKFSKIEVRDLAKAWIVISIAFAIVLTQGILGISFLTNLLLSAIAVGSAFLFHELAHKFVAQKYGCFAEFRSDNKMLLLAIILALVLKVIFVAPGAVMIAGRISKARNGKISMAGPGTNFALAGIFLILALIIPNGFWGNVFGFGLFVNIWIGLFNMIPVWVLDGKKILNWNKLVYFSMLAVGGGLLALMQYLSLSPLF